jgi:hypothetical protein
MSFTIQRLSACLLAALLWLGSGTAFARSAAGVVSFTGVKASSVPQADYDSGIIEFDQNALVLDGGIAASSLTSGSARAQTLPGVNRIEVSNSAPVDDEALRASSIGGPFSAAVSGWYDTFTVTGGTGAGTARISSSVTGQFGNGFGATGMYMLFKVTPANLEALLDDPLSPLLDDALPQTLLALEQNVIDTSRFIESGELLEPGSAFGGTLVGEVDFVYGQPFVLLSVMAGFANDFGSLSSFNSAVFGITAPDGKALLTGSGYQYAAAVPEPATLLLMALALPLLAWSVRRHRG